MTVALLGRRALPSVAVGPGIRTSVMALVGSSHIRDFGSQRAKIDALAQMEVGPDIVSDLSIVASNEPLLECIVSYGFVAATLPVYSAVSTSGQIDRSALLNRAIEQMERGAGLLTIHPTPTRELVRLARRRRVPWTSRGGGLVINDLLLRGDGGNAYQDIMPKLAEEAARRGVTLSLGASFRSANIFDSLDEAQLGEIAAQLDLASQLVRSGTSVIVESPGHARPRDILRVASILAPAGFPVMPLGPIPTDAADGQDHVSAAIGATLMGVHGAAHVLAAVTREEHTGGIPSLESTLEAVRAARVAAHIIDLHNLDETAADEAAVQWRAEHRTCVDGKQTAGCSRCGTTCPL
ncbi:MAG: phosphomethylpyrimidine synthase ThiC [Deltaproteobacteria bacterium]|nr:phosphomethylpyrimidine synthase ThiC [Deltaproteobacteria bacterium]